MHRLFSLAVFLLLAVAATAIGGQFTGGDWYYVLFTPAWTPSPMVMTSVWSVLFVLMAVSAWMVWDTMRGLAAAALAWWGLQLLLSIMWSLMFFGWHRIGLATAIVSLWFVVVVIVIKTFRPIKPEAASLMVPLAAWLIFLCALNFNQWQLNGGGLGSIF